MITKFTITKKKKIDTLHQYYAGNSDLIKSKSRKYRADNKDVIQTRKSQHYVQSRLKTCEKRRSYCDKNVDFVKKKTRISTNQNRTELFTKLIKEGTNYTCVICSRCMYQKGTKKFDQNKYKGQFEIIDLKLNTVTNCIFA